MSLTHREVSEIRLRLNNGEKGCKLAKEFGVSNAYISQIKSKKKGTKQVWLTVEEAKEFLIAFQDLIELHEDGYIKITDFGFDTFDLVKKRIEQAEGK